jgi:hypothetical protein
VQRSANGAHMCLTADIGVNRVRQGASARQGFTHFNSALREKLK